MSSSRVSISRKEMEKSHPNAGDLPLGAFFPMSYVIENVVNCNILLYHGINNIPIAQQYGFCRRYIFYKTLTRINKFTGLAKSMSLVTINLSSVLTHFWTCIRFSKVCLSLIGLYSILVCFFVFLDGEHAVRRYSNTYSWRYLWCTISGIW